MLMSLPSYGPGLPDLGEYVNAHYNPSSPLVIPIPHAGLIIPLPNTVGQHLNLNSEDVINTLDIGVDYSVASIMGMQRDQEGRIIIGETLDSVVVHNSRRAVVDPNRGRRDYDRFSVIGGGSDKPMPHGVFWYSTTGTDGEHRRLPFDPYPLHIAEQLLEAVYDPFAKTRDEFVNRAMEEHGYVIIFDLHSIWPNAFDIVPDGPFKNAYNIGQLVGHGSFDDGKMPDAILMDSDGKSCAPEISNYVLEVFKRHGLIIERHSVAGSGYELPRNRLSDPKNNVHAVSIEFVGHDLEPERAQGIITKNPDRQSLEKVQETVFELTEGLRTGKFRN